MFNMGRRCRTRELDAAEKATPSETEPEGRRTTDAKGHLCRRRRLCVASRDRVPIPGSQTG